MQGTQVRSLGWEDPLAKGMETHSSILAWEIPWTEEPGGLHPWGHRRVKPDLATKEQQQQNPWVVQCYWSCTIGKREIHHYLTEHTLCQRTCLTATLFSEIAYLCLGRWSSSWFLTQLRTFLGKTEFSHQFALTDTNTGTYLRSLTCTLKCVKYPCMPI